LRRLPLYLKDQASQNIADDNREWAVKEGQARTRFQESRVRACVYETLQGIYSMRGMSVIAFAIRSTSPP